MSNGFDTIKFSKVGAIARISLDRPKYLNAHSMQMRDDIYQALEAVRDDSEIHCLILTGEGERAFCTGADLSEFGTAPSRVIARQVRWERDLWGLFLSIDKPIIAALHGYVLGSGVEMALLCDLRVASDDAIFGMPEAGLGMIPVAGGTQTLWRHVGVSKAMDMLLSGRRIGAKEALDVGLVHRVVKKSNLSSEVDGLARKLTCYTPEVLRAIKIAVKTGIDIPIRDGLEMELSLAVRTVSMVNGV